MTSAGVSDPATLTGVQPALPNYFSSSAQPSDKPITVKSGALDYKG